MTPPLALRLAALLTALLTATALFGVSHASAAVAQASASVTSQAVKGKQCMPRPARQSLIVRGKVACKEVKRFLPRARELALVTVEHGYERFTIRGFMCELGSSPRRFACHDIDGQPKRSFVWADKT